MTSEAQTICEYIRNEIGYQGEIDPAADLIAAEVLDSFTVVELAMFIQTRFEIELEPEDLVRENLCTLSSLLALIESKKKARQ